MSVRTLAAVWERSTRAGSELLLMLAIADFADDNGNAYPAIATLATKCRMTPRNVNHILVALKACGELEVRLGEGPKGCNRYRIVLDGKGLKPASPLKSSSPLKGPSPPEGAFTLKPASGTPEAGFPKPLKPASPKPSLNRQEPIPTPGGVGGEQHVAGSPSAAGEATSACPHDQIIAAFHELLPTARRVRDWTPTRQQVLRARWREDLRRQSLDWWRKFFAYVAQSPFLTGQVHSRGRKPFELSLDWLVKQENFVRVREGAYHDEVAA